MVVEKQNESLKEYDRQCDSRLNGQIMMIEALQLEMDQSK